MVVLFLESLWPETLNSRPLNVGGERDSLCLPPYFQLAKKFSDLKEGKMVFSFVCVLAGGADTIKPSKGEKEHGESPCSSTHIEVGGIPGSRSRFAERRKADCGSVLASRQQSRASLGSAGRFDRATSAEVRELVHRMRSANSFRGGRLLL